MRTAALLLALLFTSCAETRFYEDGQLVAVIQGDAIDVTVTTHRGSTFHAASLNHSKPTSAAYTGASEAVGAVGGAATAIGAVIR